MTAADGPVELIAEDPPAPRSSLDRRGWGVTGPWLNQLRGVPGVWHRHPDLQNGTGLSSAIKGGRYKGAAAGEFEATTRTVVVNGKNRFHVYARYVGGDQ